MKKDILKEIWSKEAALKENLLKTKEAEDLRERLLKHLEEILPENSLPWLRFRKIKEDRRFQTWWSNASGYPASNPWSMFEPFLEILAQHEAEKTIKHRLEVEGLFVETRSRDEDLHILVGERSGSGEKAHIILDGKTAEIRVEDGRKEPTEIAAKVEGILTLPNGKKIRTTREAIEEIADPNSSSVTIEVEINKISLGVNMRLAEGLAQSFIVTIPVLIKNFSKNKIHLRNIHSSLKVPEGYAVPNQFGSSFTSEKHMNGEEVLPGTFQFSTSIPDSGRGVSPDNAEWMRNKEKILSAIDSAKIEFSFSAETISLLENSTIEESFDLSNILKSQIFEKK